MISTLGVWRGAMTTSMGEKRPCKRRWRSLAASFAFGVSKRLRSAQLKVQGCENELRTPLQRAQPPFHQCQLGFGASACAVPTDGVAAGELRDTL